MEWIAGPTNHEHKLDFVQCSESPGKPARYVSANGGPATDPLANAREMRTGFKRRREDSDKLIA